MASSGVAPSARIAGVETTAPPTPNIPDSTPVSDADEQRRTIELQARRARNAEHPTRRGRARYAFRMTSDLDLRGVWIPLITPFDAAGAVDVDAIERLCREYLAAGVDRHRRARHHRRVDRARRGREARASSTRARRACTAAARAADRRHRHEQHAHDDRRDERARRHRRRRRRARRRAVLRAPVGSRDRRALPGGRRREPGAGRRSTTSRPAPAAASARPRCSSSPRIRTSPA